MAPAWDDFVEDLLNSDQLPEIDGGTLLLSFTGWMDGGDASTGTVSRLIRMLDAEQVAGIDPEPYYIFNVPGSMTPSVPAVRPTL